MLFNTETSKECLQFIVDTKTPRLPNDIVQFAFLIEPEKAKIIASNTSWLVVSFNNTHITCNIAKELSKNKYWETLIFQYGCTFEEGAFLYLENSNTKNLFLSGSKLNNNNIIEIMSCSKWENLDFSFCNLTDESLPIILKEKSWKIISLSGNQFSQNNIDKLNELHDLYQSYVFNERISYEEKKEKIKVIYTRGYFLDHRSLVPM